MDMRLITQSKRTDGIFSELFDDDEIHSCFTLEMSILGVSGQEPIIPRGAEYVCKRGMHKLSNGVEFETFEVTGVDGHYGLVFHKGNLERDTKGCPLVGENINICDDGWFMESSGKAFDAFMKLQEGVDTFILTVE